MMSENPLHPSPDHTPSLRGSSPTSSLPSPAATMTSISTNSADATTTSTSTSAPEFQAIKSTDAASVVVSLSADTVLMYPSRTTPTESVSGVASPAETSGGPGTPSEPDAQIIEALRSKDRLYVLKLGEQMETLITERRTRIDLNPATSYQRMLVHRCSAYYKLSPETDTATKTISVYYRTESRIPARRISELVPAEESAQPAFVIMRRTPQDRRQRQSSQPESVAGDDDGSEGDESVGGRSNATSSGKRHLTIAEREAAYNEARSRIFMDFESKEKEKEKDMSANSSTFSLVSGSSTSGGRSSFGEVDDSASSAATESELSGPPPGDRRGGRRGGSTASSSRSLRSGHHAGSGSSRNSRATSPSFTFPSLYDPSGNTFEPAYGAQAPPQGYIPPYYPPYPQAGYPAAQPYPSAYPYPYPPYGYPPLQHHPDATSPSGPESMYGAPQGQPPPMMAPYQSYLWPPGQHGAPMPPATSPASATGSLPGAQSQITPPQSMQYPGYFPTGYPPYYSPSQYPPNTNQTIPPPHPPMQGGYFPPEYMQGMDMHLNANGNNDHSRASSRNSNNHGGNNNNGRRGPSRSRQQAWNYPGAPPSGGYYSPGSGPSDTVGPRLSSRRTSSSSVGTGSRTPGDEASSTASSSTTSSSSRRTFTSSTSSKHHPLPARPDWAVGLKAQPTLSTRHADPRTMSPARIGGHLPNQHHHNQPQPSQPPLQATDFPPLSSAPEKRTPVVGGAWTNASTVRSVLNPGAPASGNALVHYPNSSANTSPNPGVGGPGSAFMNARLDDQDRFERPPPKGNAELYNPKAKPQRPAANGGSSHGSGSGASVPKFEEGGLVEKMECISLDGPATPPAQAQSAGAVSS